jgi:hypothetical protein
MIEAIANAARRTLSEISAALGTQAHRDSAVKRLKARGL